MKIYIVLINAAVVALKDESVLSYDCSSNLINNNNFSTNQNQGRQNSNDLFSNSEHLESNLATFHIIIYFYIQYLGAYPSESYIHLLYRLYMGEFGSPGYAPTTLHFLILAHSAVLDLRILIKSNVHMTYVAQKSI